MEMKLIATPGEPVMIDKALLQTDDSIDLDLSNGAKLSLQVYPCGFEVDSQDELSITPSYMDKLILKCEPQQEPKEPAPFQGVLHFNGMELRFFNNARFQVSLAGGEKLYLRLQNDGLVISRRQCRPIAFMATSENSFYSFILAKDPRLSNPTVNREGQIPVTQTSNSIEE